MIIYDFTVIGGGLVGLSTALALLRARPGCRLLLLEKEPECGRHQSTHNSGVLHAGLYYTPGSLKARLAVDGIRKMTSYCREHSIPHEICGKVVVATDDVEKARLDALFHRGKSNGLSNLKMLGAEELREREPHANGVAALLVPEEGIVDYAAVISHMVEDIQRLGGAIQTSAPLHTAKKSSAGWLIVAGNIEAQTKQIINCAGLYCDKVAKMFGERPRSAIIPFRGEYYKLRPSASKLASHLIYPVPDPTFPFLGVHFTRLIHGGVEAGPNAVLAFAREGYKKTTIRPAELADALLYPGLWRFLGKHRGMCLQEFAQSLLPKLFVKALQKLVPAITLSDLQTGGAGVRAQAMSPEGALVQDFDFIRSDGALHVLNAPSPAATASLAIGEDIARSLL